MDGATIKLAEQHPKSVTIPWTETIIDPLGNEREITLDIEVNIADIWKWRRQYSQGDNPLTKKQDKAASSTPEATIRMGISKRLTTIEKWKKTDTIKRSDRVSKLVDILKALDPELLPELALMYRDRLQNIATLPDTLAADCDFLGKLL